MQQTYRDADTVLPRRGNERNDPDELPRSLTAHRIRPGLRRAHIAARERFFYRVQLCTTAPAMPRASQDAVVAGTAPPSDAA